MITFLCEDSISGVFSGIYEAWAGHYNREEIRMRTGAVGNYELFMEYKNIPCSLPEGEKVSKRLRRQFGEETYEKLCYALWSGAEDKADVVYQMVKYGLEHRCGANLQHLLTVDCISRVDRLYQNAFNEGHHYLGFLRFRELKNGMLYAAVEPKNYILDVLSSHFTDRLPGENWMIHDRARNLAAVHSAGGDWFTVDAKAVEPLWREECSAQEEGFQELWRIFCRSISIEARENLNLQRQNLPLRFRKYMVSL